MDTLGKGITIFLARILDVSIGTVKTMTLVHNKVMLSTFLSFLEVLIWYLVAREALIDGTTITGVFYASGYAVGTLIGSLINKRMSSTVISRKNKEN